MRTAATSHGKRICADQGHSRLESVSMVTLPLAFSECIVHGSDQKVYIITNCGLIRFQVTGFYMMAEQYLLASQAEK